MRSKNLMMVLAAGVLACTLVVTNGLGQGQPGEKTPVLQEQRGKKMTVEGQIKKAMRGGGYVIQAHGEVLSIANQYPAVLEPLSMSGETVSIEAYAFGDRLNILAINGKKYQDPQKPAVK
jgi:hypothetical protein